MKRCSVTWFGSAFLAAWLAASCTQSPTPVAPAVAAPGRLTAADEAFLDDLEARTFRFFWERANPANGLVPDRWPTPSFSSIAAVGFGLTALPIGVERGYVDRAAAAERALVTLRFFHGAPQGPEPAGRTGHRGFFYHFVDMEAGRRFERVELSSIDTTLFLAGALTCQRYFDRDTAVEREIRELADALYRAVDWSFLLVRPPLVAMGWTPEEGFHGWDWKGYDEAMLLYLLALGSPTHPVDPAAWKAYHATSRFETYQGEEHFNFSPLFGHHYTQAWVDFRGLLDGELGARGLDYFENTRRATITQHRYAVANPGGFVGYGADLWGLTACDGPFDGELEIAGRKRTFRTYAPRGASTLYVLDDGTISPSAAGGSLPFTPELSLRALRTMKERYGSDVYGPYGFLDAFSPTLTVPAPLRHGKVVEGVGWFDTDYLGIDQGILLVMLENYRSGLVWRLMRESPYLVTGLERAGFRGGWLAARNAR